MSLTEMAVKLEMVAVSVELSVRLLACVLGSDSIRLDDALVFLLGGLL